MMNNPLLYSTLLVALFVPFNLIAWNDIGIKIINNLCEAIKGIELSVEFSYNWDKNSLKIKECSLIPKINNNDPTLIKFLRQTICSTIIQTTTNIENRRLILEKLRKEAQNTQINNAKLKNEIESLNLEIEKQKKLQKEKDLECIAEFNRLKEKLSTT